MGRAPCCDKIGLKKGPWTTEEDEKLASFISQHGVGSWRALPKKAGLLRCGKSCRLRWTNYLRPDIKRGEFTAAEEQTIIQLHALLGNRWSAIATHLPKRTDNEIKNYWNTHLKKRLLSMGLDPATHKPKTQGASCGDSSLTESSKDSHTTSSLSHMAQWESARLEAEARLAKETSLRGKGLWPTLPSKPPSCDASSQPKHCNLMSSTQVCGSLSTTIPLKYEATGIQSKQDTSSSKGWSASELINTLQNWENSLQGQAGLMWPESWRFLSSRSAFVEGQQESSSCSSPQERANYGSPISTLCFFDRSSKRVQAVNHSSPSHTRKLSWSDILQDRVLLQDRALGSRGNDTTKIFPFVELDGSRAVSNGGESLLAYMQDRGGSTHDSSGLLDELELASEDVSSTKSSSILSSEEELDNYWDNLLVDSPRQAGAHESMYM